MASKRRQPKEPKVVVVTRPDIEALFAEQRKARKQIEVLEEEIYGLDQEIQCLVSDHYFDTTAERIDPINIVIAHVHVCPKGSPTGLCVYDDEEDPRHDSCIYCHDPRERK